ncbi:MAG TPA: ABC transporter permease [Pseudomonadales bacterium]|nr:ABC transporter permease [Pseudomonadales bacterium]
MMASHSNSPTPMRAFARWLYRLQVMTQKELMQVLRDKVLMGFVIYGFTMGVYLAGDSVSLQLDHARLMVSNNDPGALSRELIYRFRAPEFEFVGLLDKGQRATQLLDAGEAMMVLDIPADFSQRILEGRGTGVQIQVDSSNSMLSFLAASYAARIVGMFGMEQAFLLMGQRPEQVMKKVPVVTIEPQVWYNPNQNDAWFMPINQLAEIITLLSIMLPAAAMVKEKERGTIEQILVTPLTPFQIMFPKVLAMTLVILVGQALCISLVMLPFFDIPIRGSLIWLFVFTALYVFANAGLGMLTATFSRNLGQVGLLVVLSLSPILFLSGLYTPPEAMPSWLRSLMYLSPLYYYRQLIFSVFLQGNAVSTLMPAIAGMLALGSALFVIGMARFRRQF